jgi:hypothetical protein
MTMFTYKRNVLFLLLSFCFLLPLILLIYYLPPTFQIQILNFKFQIIFIFFILFFFFLFSISTCIFKSITHGILIGLFTATYLIFRLNNLTDPFFLAVLFAIFLFLELFFSLGRQRVHRMKEKIRPTK